MKDLLAYLSGLAVSQGRLAGQPFTVLPWQRKFIRSVFALDVQSATLSVARSNGKTALLSGIAAATLDGPLAVPRGETVIVASSFELARIAFEHVVAFMGGKLAGTSPRSEVASPGSRPRWREPWGLRRPRLSTRPARSIRQCGTWSGTIFDSRGEREKTVTDEILLIVLAGAWLFVHVIAHGLTQWVAAGNTWAFGARDDPPRETLLSGRLRRAFANYLETLPAALVVLIAAELSDRANEFTSYGGWIWFGSRVIYLPAYASGIRWLRSIVWGVATVAIAIMALGLILGVS